MDEGRNRSGSRPRKPAPASPSSLRRASASGTGFTREPTLIRAGPRWPRARSGSASCLGSTGRASTFSKGTPPSPTASGKGTPMSASSASRTLTGGAAFGRPVGGYGNQRRSGRELAGQGQPALRRGKFRGFRSRGGRGSVLDAGHDRRVRREKGIGPEGETWRGRDGMERLMKVAAALVATGRANLSDADEPGSDCSHLTRQPAPPIPGP